MPTTSPDPADRPLRSVIDDLERGRGNGQFRAVEGGRIQCLTCPRCETQGTLVLRYGPDASMADADVLRALA